MGLYRFILEGFIWADKLLIKVYAGPFIRSYIIRFRLVGSFGM